MLGCKFGSGTPVTVAGELGGGLTRVNSLSGLSVTANYGTLALRLTYGHTDVGGSATAARLPAFAKAYMTAGIADALDAPATAAVSPAGFDAGLVTKGQPLTRLQPSEDMVVRVYLTDKYDALVGSGMVERVKIRPGSNSLDVPITANKSEAQVLGASGALSTADGVIVKGATLTMQTGVADGSKGINRVDIEINGPAYGGGQKKSLIASLDAPSIEEYRWLPNNASESYEPASLVAGCDPVPFTLTHEAIDPYGTVVARTTVPLAVVATAFVDVGVNDNPTQGQSADADGRDPAFLPKIKPDGPTPTPRPLCGPGS